MAPDECNETSVPFDDTQPRSMPVSNRFRYLISQSPKQVKMRVAILGKMFTFNGSELLVICLFLWVKGCCPFDPGAIESYIGVR